ncbi:MAG: preprotein translocase subunit SecG [Gammaproteobacteria bacterium]|nr:preprotein translocase subunit SecG [Gammaproteobacteria bacterium]
MQTLQTVLLILLLIDAVALAAIVLLQQGKGADVGAAFGSGSANTMFGSAGSTSFLTKMTVYLAIGFFVIAFGLAYTAKEIATDMRSEGLSGFGDLETPLDDEGLPPAPASDPESDLPDV